ncbi:MAG TPA: hypothetical protein VKV05_06530 [Terriglobales bacterium]|nr:hypothetical protein [Terriglobales bacterium]
MALLDSAFFFSNSWAALSVWKHRYNEAYGCMTLHQNWAKSFLALVWGENADHNSQFGKTETACSGGLINTDGGLKRTFQFGREE